MLSYFCSAEAWIHMTHIVHIFYKSSNVFFNLTSCYKVRNYTNRKKHLKNTYKNNNLVRPHYFNKITKKL